MSTPKTWDLIVAAEACLASISTANGYYTNAGAAVNKEPGQIPESAGIALALAIDSISRPDDPAWGRTALGVTFVVIGKVSTTATDSQIRLHELIDDIQKAFTGKQAQFSVGQRFPVFLEARPIPPQDGMAWVGCEVRFSSQVAK